MSNVVPFSPISAASDRVEAAYIVAWTDYYASVRSVMSRDGAMDMADAHVAYLKNRDAEVLAGVAAAMAVQA